MCVPRAKRITVTTAAAATTASARASAATTATAKRIATVAKKRKTAETRRSANAAEGIQADGTVIVQGAEHIKAVENQGTFDAGNPAIRYSLVEEGRMEAEGKDVFHERQGSARPRGVSASRQPACPTADR